jgi:ribosomal protein S18 acetylase RimI-like enzyme
VSVRAVPFGGGRRFDRAHESHSRHDDDADGHPQEVDCLGVRATGAVSNPRLSIRWQGRGVGASLLGAAIELADQWLNLTRLELTVFTDNARAIALYKRCGFDIEGTLRQYAFRDGAFVDAYGMARVRTAKEADSACIVRPV